MMKSNHRPLGSGQKRLLGAWALYAALAIFGSSQAALGAGPTALVPPDTQLLRPPAATTPANMDFPRGGDYEAAVGRFLPMSGESEEGQYCMGVMYKGPLSRGQNSANADGKPLTWFLCAAEGTLPPFFQEFASLDQPFNPGTTPQVRAQTAAYHALAPKHQLHGRYAKPTTPSSVPLHAISAEEAASAPEITTQLILLPADLGLKGLQAVAEFAGAAALSNRIGNIRFGGNDLLFGFLAAACWGAVVLSLLRLRRFF